MSRVIVHLDADAFFASVEQAADKRLRGKPIAVGGERRGIIASASYEARKFGVYTPMPTARARKLCPKLIILSGDFERYEQFSNWMFGYCYDFTPDVEQTSIDEGYFDLTTNHAKPHIEIAQTIRQAIRQSLKISVSEGIGANKLVSQIASKLNKPAAFTSVPPGNEIPFLHPLPNRWLPGIGPKTATRLNSAGLALIRHIAATPLDLLELLLGNQARQIRQFAHGVDDRLLIPAREPQKSFSQQETFEQDLTDEGYVEAVLRRMADQLFAKVRQEDNSIRTLTVKVRYNDMAEDQCSESLPEPTDLETDMYGRLHVMLQRAWKRRVSLRMVSLKLSNIYSGVFRAELALDRGAEQQEARERLARVVDELRRTKGATVLLRGHDFRLKEKPAEASVSPRLTIRLNLSTNKTCSAKAIRYIPLRVHSYYSFLDSTLSPQAIVELAKRHGCRAVAVTDTGNLHGAVEFSEAAKQAGIKPIFGAELCVGQSPLVLYVENLRGYHNLCRLLSRKAEAGDEESVAAQQAAPITREALAGFTEGLIAAGGDSSLADLFPARFYQLAANRHMRDNLPAVACPSTCYATPEDRLGFDIVQSIRTRTLLKQAHPAKRLGGRYHFRTPAEMAASCRERTDWLLHTQEIAERCSFELPLGKPQFPAFRAPDDSSSREFLRRLVLEGLHRRYHGRRIVSDTGQAVPLETVCKQIETELSIIAEVGYEDLFLITWDLLQECRAQGIEWITRGSAADSLVCYCLGISDVCPIRFGLYFRRFLNKERMAMHKLPDIDVDFPHDRKDDVVNLLFKKYGPEHCAVVGGFSTFQARSAVADVAKVLGVSEFQIRRFTEHFPWSFGGGWIAMEHVRPRGAELIEKLKASPECRDLPLEEEPFRTAVEMAVFLDGFPRHPKMHPCGVVLSRQPMHELTPTFISNKGWPTTHFDMDAVEAVGLVKMDILAQGGLAVMRDAKQSLAARGIQVDLAGLEPRQDPNVWEMIASGNARAVHHIESPAMTSLCRMSNVREIDGLVAIVSVIRPGAANEHKKLKFTRRYQRMEPPEYPHPSLEPCLRSTFGLVVYEEHILQICEAFAGLDPGRADVLRRALVKQKWKDIEVIVREFAESARARGHSPEKIKEVWELVTSFNGYAFCKAHSTAYGVEAYQAAWLKRYYPAEFMAGVLTNGKGFYDPLVYVLECHRLGLKFLPPSINRPGPAFMVESGAIRVPAVRAKGLRERTIDRVVAERERGPFMSLADFHCRACPSSEEMEILIRVGAFDEFGRSRTAQFWEAQQLHRVFGQSASGQGWLLPPADLNRLPQTALREPTCRERLEAETELLGFAVSSHPLELFNHVVWDTYCPVSRLGGHVGKEVVTCGLIVEQRTHHQITGEPMKFLTLADWTGMVETELFAATYRSYGLATVRYPVLEVTATVEPFENGRGFSLRVLRAGKPRQKLNATPPMAIL
jgi:DNA-directed DNA polymerase III PolC